MKRQKRDRTPYPHPELEATYCVPLTRNKVALIDATDLGPVGGFRWHTMNRSGRWYARRSVLGPTGETTEYMHHLVIGSPGPGFHVDHINHDGLDNRRSNLRVVSVSTNIQNRRAAHGKSRFLGVSWKAGRRLWEAGLRKNGRRFYAGYFQNETEAAHAYDELALRLYGPLARTNFGPNGIHAQKEPA